MAFTELCVRQRWVGMPILGEEWEIVCGYIRMSLPKENVPFSAPQSYFSICRGISACEREEGKAFRLEGR
jgi:hypothetical protein